MRELINIITESRGLGARRPGEVFVNDAGEEIRVNTVDFFPAGGGQFPTAEEMQDAIDTVVQQLGVNPESVNRPNAGTLAFGVAIFDSDTGPLAYLKYFKTVHPDPTQNDWNNQTGIPGFKYNSTAAKKTQSSATPQDILTQQEDLTAEDIAMQVAEKFPNSTLAEVAIHLARGGELPYTFAAPVEMDITAFRDYFCELLQPIALQTGQYEGEAQDAEAIFLPDGGYATTLISFSNSKTEGLSDSIMIGPDGRKMKVSSKGGKGADASTKNLLDSVAELNQTPAGAKLVNKFKNTIELLETVKESGQSLAPLVLGQRYGIIDEGDAQLVVSIKKMPLVDITDVKKLKMLTPTLRKLAEQRSTKNPTNTNLYFHLMAAIAHRVAEHVQENTSFNKDAAAILNNSALVQVYTTVSARGDQWTLNTFVGNWPGSAVTTVEFSADKGYYSTDIKGNFTFAVDPPKKKKGGTAAEPAPVIKMKDPGDSMSADKVTRPGRRAEPRDKDTTPRQKRDK
jgi:hypothetical protein